MVSCDCAAMTHPSSTCFTTNLYAALLQFGGGVYLTNDVGVALQVRYKYDIETIIFYSRIR